MIACASSASSYTPSLPESSFTSAGSNAVHGMRISQGLPASIASVSGCRMLFYAAVGFDCPRRHGAMNQVPRHHQPLDLGRPLADTADAQLTVPALQRQVAGDAVAAVDLQRAVHHTAGGLGREELARGCLEAVGLVVLSLLRCIER